MAATSSVDRRSDPEPVGSGRPSGALLAQSAVWLAAAAVVALAGQPLIGLSFVAVGAATLTIEWLSRRREERARWREPIRELTEQVSALAENPSQTFQPSRTPETAHLVDALRTLHRRILEGSVVASPSRSPKRPSPTKAASLTRSGMFEPPSDLLELEGGGHPEQSGEISTRDLVCRLEPDTLRWLETSPSVLRFLGSTLDELRGAPFLQIIHPEDRATARDQMREALAKGESHGLIWRIRAAQGHLKVVEANLGVRYGPDMTPRYLRCHFTDITDKIRAERELKRKTRELTQANEQLRCINRELNELKDRYSDLYQNAPAMYFSLDEHGRLVECNNTMLQTLGYQRQELIGQSYTKILPELRRDTFPERFRKFLEAGSIAVESQWRKADGTIIDVWIMGTAVLDQQGKLHHSRSVAQDITAQKALQAELTEKNERLARANAELSRKNKELDEFTYIVSHDLQEPLRSLIAFSDFLMSDYGDKLDDTGKEYLDYLVQASRRMRSLINDLLQLSRVGRVIGDFRPVDLGEVITIIKADFAERIRAQGVEIRVIEPLPTVWGDGDRIAQLFGNLIGNGLKYNRSPVPVVEVGVAPTADSSWATLFVRDNGIGIDPRFHARIFQIFRRLHAHDEYEGTGAGLAICQKIVQAHGGRIWVESQPNHGATFYLTLPRPPADDPVTRTEMLHAH